MLNRLLTYFITLLLSVFVLPLNAASPKRTSVAAVITVEGLSSDYLRMLEDFLSPGGLKRLMSTGATIERLYYGPAIDAAAASAIVMTGAAPMTNGIPGEKVYDTTTHLTRSPLYDKKVIGNFTDETFSPAPIKVSTIADEVIIHSDGLGRVYSLAPRSFEAIIGAGHAGNGAYWINDMTAVWSSSAYYKDMPEAVRNRNYRNSLASRLDTMRWTPLYNLSLYPGLSDNQLKKPFSNRFPAKDIQRVRRFLDSPLANTEVTDLALELINEAHIGHNSANATDMICLAYNVPTVGSRVEILDSYLRLDRDIARLLNALDTAAPGSLTVMLAATPSTDGASADDQRYNIPSGLYSVKRALSLLGIQLMAVHGNGDWILGYSNRHFYLNRKLIKDRGLSLQDFRREVADFLGRMAGISNVLTIDDIMASRAGDDPAALKRNTSLEHAGDVIIEVSPGWQIVDDGTGRASGVQRHSATDMPAFFIGPDIRRIQYDQPIDARTLAPTLARLLLIRAPNGASVPALHL